MSVSLAHETKQRESLPILCFTETLEGLPVLSCEDVWKATKQGNEMQVHLIWKILEQAPTAL